MFSAKRMFYSLIWNLKRIFHMDLAHNHEHKCKAIVIGRSQIRISINEWTNKIFENRFCITWTLSNHSTKNQNVTAFDEEPIERI